MGMQGEPKIQLSLEQFFRDQGICEPFTANTYGCGGWVFWPDGGGVSGEVLTAPNTEGIIMHA